MAKYAQIHDARIKTVAVGLSGGVDSAVSAWLLKEAGHSVFGIYMQNWVSERDDPYCTAEQDLSDAAAVADQLSIPFHVVNFAKTYWDHVFQHCLDEFAKGRTPNPDVWCNREIKFKALLNHARSLGATHLATGHYARIEREGSAYRLLKSTDNTKDQTYFLYLLGQAELANSLFPLADVNKTEVRRIAQKLNLVNYAKKDSTGICFIGERRFKDFLSNYLLAAPGNMETPDGQVVGQHDGVMFYTLGQRHGLQIGGRNDAKQEPWYVLAKDVERNVLVVGQGHDHPLLFAKQLICDSCHWIAGVDPIFPLTCTAKTRYRQREKSCQVERIDKHSCKVTFAAPERALTPGQSIVFYQDEVCLGGGIINEVIQSP